VDAQRLYNLTAGLRLTSFDIILQKRQHSSRGCAFAVTVTVRRHNGDDRYQVGLC
jgi:hypothetical protein